MTVLLECIDEYFERYIRVYLHALNDLLYSNYKTSSSLGIQTLLTH